jgi:hypothetical protein
MLTLFAAYLSQADGKSCLIDEQRHKNPALFLKIFLQLLGKNYTVGIEIDTRLIDEVPERDPYI